MQYQDAVDAFFATPDQTTEPSPVTAAAPARQLRDAFEPVSMHAVWSPLVHERMAAKGMDFFQAYVWGRACVMGEPAGSVVASAFAAFEPSLIGGIYDSARASMSREEAHALTFDSTAESLRSTLGDDAEAKVSAVGERLAGIVDSLDPTGRPLFAGVAALGWPEDAYGRLFQACLALREHRGDAHVASYIGAGFGPVEMNILTELWLGYPLGEYSGTRAWPEDTTAAAIDGLTAAGLLDGEALTAEGVRVRDEIENATDAMEQKVVDALGADFDATAQQLASWSETCVQARTFPPDPRKRAAG